MFKTSTVKRKTRIAGSGSITAQWLDHKQTKSFYPPVPPGPEKNAMASSALWTVRLALPLGAFKISNPGSRENDPSATHTHGATTFRRNV